jgi:hypothetical protein
MIASVPTCEGPLRLVASPIKIAGVSELYRAPPALGEHTEIYTDCMCDDTGT